MRIAPKIIWGGKTSETNSPVQATTEEIKSRHICWEMRREWNETLVPSSVTFGEKWLSPIRTANLSDSRCCSASVCARVCARKVSMASINFDGERRHYIAMLVAKRRRRLRPPAHAASNWNLCLSPAHSIFRVINFYSNTSLKRPINAKISLNQRQEFCGLRADFGTFWVLMRGN